MRILVVDDMQKRHDFFREKHNGMDDMVVQSYDYDNAILELSSTPYDFDLMYLDHDLSIEAILCDPHSTFEKTGSDIAEFIARSIDPTKCDDLEIYCHSMNPAGRENMVKILVNAGFNAHDCSFYELQYDIP